jgi:folate-binding protein YgfZ
MGLTALQIHGDGRGDVQSTPLGAGFAEYKTGEYRGATTAARFNDPQQEWEAMRSGCAVYDLGYRAKVLLTGGDRVRWLNGMVTNNIRDLALGRGVYAFLLNPQGHILGDLYAYNRGEPGGSGSIESSSIMSDSILSSSIVVDTDRSQLERILATFDHYIIMDDVEVTNLSDSITALGVAGPKARSVLQRAGIAVPEMQPLQILDAACECECDCVKCTVVCGEDTDSFELWLAPAEGRKTWDALRRAGASPAGFEALELRRILAGIPRYSVDIRERDLPQETEQARALNFNKGCYVGQEIVERIRSRGAVHRKFSGFLLDGAAQIAASTKILAGEKEVGEITSVASVRSPGGMKTVALGYVRREMSVPGREVTVGKANATLLQLPVDLDVLSQPQHTMLQQNPA